MDISDCILRKLAHHFQHLLQVHSNFPNALYYTLLLKFLSPCMGPLKLLGYNNTKIS
jgi:hypothetical protein